MLAPVTGVVAGVVAPVTGAVAGVLAPLTTVTGLVAPLPARSPAWWPR